MANLLDRPLDAAKHAPDRAKEVRRSRAARLAARRTREESARLRVEARWLVVETPRRSKWQGC
jgi:hypothetical protein